LLGDAPRTVEYWVRHFEEDGLAGLVELERSGRPKRLTAEQIQEINRVLRNPPEAVDLTGNLWSGKLLSAFIEQQFGVRLGVRRCQYMFRDFGFRLRKPRPLIARADPQVQEQYKKTRTDGE